MPANLPPQYYEAEKEYRSARTPQAKVEALERMLAIMPHHKGTDHLRADLRTRIARLNQEAERQRAAGGRTQLYTVRKEGAGQVALVGLPNAGKSHLLGSLTGATPKIGDYPYTTQLPQPAMMPCEDIKVQLVDLPPITPGDTPGWVRGLLRQADLLLLIVDLAMDPLSDFESLMGELQAQRVEPVAPEASGSGDQVLLSRKSLLLANKLDLPGSSEVIELLEMEVAGRLPVLPISAARGDGLEQLRYRVVEALGVIRVYAKPRGRPPDLKRPFVLPRGATVSALAETIHHQLSDTLRYAVLWPSDRPSLRVARDYVLQDRDVIELHGAP